MKAYYIYILLVGVFSFIIHSYAANFNGENEKAKTVFQIFSGLGFLSFFALIITMFFYVRWWHPIAIFVVASIIAPFLERFRSIILSITSIIGLILFTVLAWISILN